VASPQVIKDEGREIREAPNRTPASTTHTVSNLRSKGRKQTEV